MIRLGLSPSDGRSVAVEASDPIDPPRKPLTDAQFEAKFRDCARNAVWPRSDTSIDAALAAMSAGNAGRRPGTDDAVVHRVDEQAYGTRSQSIAGAIPAATVSK